jgi:hypothetical protein
MPKLNLNIRNPKLCKLKKYAVCYHGGKTHYFGLYGTPEAKTAYDRFCAEIQSNPTFYLQRGESGITVAELAAAYLDHAEATMGSGDYKNCRTLVGDFLLKLFGDDTLADQFTPKCLKLVRADMIQSRRFCRRTINDYTSRIVSMFAWGVEHDHVLETTHRALKLVKSLPKKTPGVIDHPKREYVPVDVVDRTLPFMSPTLRAMVLLQRRLAMHPNEIFRMRVGTPLFINRHCGTLLQA